MKRNAQTYTGVIVSLAASLTLAGPATSGSRSAAAAPSSAGVVQGAAVTAHSSRYGKILFDARGRVLYVFARDRGGRSACSGACAKAWPPLLTNGIPAARPGVNRKLLGTTERSDGTLQVTYAKHPLYYFKKDIKPGQITCQNVSNFGGLWLVVAPSGKAVR